jgi:hypothetical protein
VPDGIASGETFACRYQDLIPYQPEVVREAVPAPPRPVRQRNFELEGSLVVSWPQVLQSWGEVAGRECHVCSHSPGVQLCMFRTLRKFVLTNDLTGPVSNYKPVGAKFHSVVCLLFW